MSERGRDERATNARSAVASSGWAGEPRRRALNAQLNRADRIAFSSSGDERAESITGVTVITVASASSVGGLPVTTWTRGKAGWLVAHRRGRTTFRAVGPGGWRLPEPLARTRMVCVGHGEHAYGAVHDPVARRLAVTLRVAGRSVTRTGRAGSVVSACDPGPRGRTGRRGTPRSVTVPAPSRSPGHRRRVRRGRLGRVPPPVVRR